MTPEAAEIAAAVVGLLVLAGCGLDVVLRPLPVLAGRIQRRRRRLFWTCLVLGYLALLALA